VAWSSVQIRRFERALCLADRSCPRNEDGSFPAHRCKGSWRYTLEYGRDSNGARLQTSKAGFPTKGAAQSALQELGRTFMVDVGVHSLTVGEYLETWLAGKHALKPKTMALLPGPHQDRR
jgi:hypothetical protein